MKQIFAAVAEVAYAYFEIGSLDAYRMRRASVDVPPYVSVQEDIVRISTGTHTGKVRIAFFVAEQPEETPAHAPRPEHERSGEVTYVATSDAMFVSTFHGIIDGSGSFHLPPDWTMARVYARSDRFEDALRLGGRELVPPELVTVIFSPAP